MDACELQFLDSAITTVTSFFTLMYIDGPDHEKVFSQVFRVLVPGGRFFIWGVALPLPLDREKDIAVFPLLVRLPDGEISTGYGTHWPERAQDLAHYLDLAGKTGFNVIEQRESNRASVLILHRP